MNVLAQEDNTASLYSEQIKENELSYSSSSSLTGSDDPYNPPHSMHWAEYLTWATAFGALVAVSLVGNSLVVWAVVCHQRMRTVTNYFLVNLALADLSMASFNVIFNCIFMLRSDWIFGKHYCTFSNFVAYLTVAASVLTLVAISADRYNIVFLIVTYLIPMSVITVAYFKMGRELWGSKAIGESSDRQVTNIKSKRRVVRMFIVVVTMFAVCWLPYHVYFLVQNHLLQTEYVQHLYLAFYWLAMSSTMYSPIIYCQMNSRFHEYFMTAARSIGICGNTRPADAKCNNLSLHSASTINTNTAGTPSPIHFGKLPNYEIKSFPCCWNDQSLHTDDRECSSLRTNCETSNGTTMITRNIGSDSTSISRLGSAKCNGVVHSLRPIIETKPLGMYQSSASNSDVIL